MLALTIAGSFLVALDAPYLLDDHIWVAGAADPESAASMRPHPNRPVLTLSFALNAQLLGDSPEAFRIVNVALHVAAALVLFGLVRRSLDLPRMPPHLRGNAVAIAFGSALLWGLHPLQTMAVTYVWQRGESMMGLFFLLTFYTFLRSTQSSGARSLGWLVASVGAFVLGCGTKEVMVAALPLLFLYDATVVTGSFREVFRRHWKRYAPHLALIVVFAARMKLALRATNDADITSLDYLASQPGVVLHYLRLAIWPSPLCFDYDWQPARGLVPVVLPSLVIVAAIVWTLRASLRARAVAFLPLWFFLVLAPTSSFVPLNDLAAEYRMYLPLAAVTTAAVVGLAWIHGALAGVRIPVLLAAASALFLLTVRRNREYLDPAEIWSSAIAVAPHNSRAHSHLAATHLQAGRFAEAEREALRALELDPGNGPARLNLGNAVLGSGRALEAVAHFEAYLSTERVRYRARLHRLVGELLLENGQPQAARTHYAAARKLEPADAEAVFGLARTLVETGKLSPALSAVRDALALDPENVQAYLLAAQVHGKLGQHEQALEVLERAMEVAPDDPKIRRVRADLLAFLRRFEAAGAAYEGLMGREPATALELSAMARNGSGAVPRDPAELAMYARIAEAAARVTGEHDPQVMENLRQTLRNCEQAGAVPDREARPTQR